MCIPRCVVTQRKTTFTQFWVIYPGLGSTAIYRCVVCDLQFIFSHNVSREARTQSGRGLPDCSPPLQMGPISCPETSVTNYQSTLRNIAEERRSQYRVRRHDNIKHFTRFTLQPKSANEIG
jgi:hypothetical protein